MDQLWANIAAQPLGFSKMNSKALLTLRWCSFVGCGNEPAVCLFGYNADKCIKNVTMQPFDSGVCKSKCCWQYVDTLIHYIVTRFGHPIIVCNESYIHYWHPILHFWVLSFASSSFLTFQSLSDLHPRYLSETWCGLITILHFRQTIYSILIIALVLGKYSSTSIPFLIQLFLFNFHDIPGAIWNISTMFNRSGWRVMQLDEWMHAAWRLSFRQIRIGHELHLL
jgi:hypothetical protein